MTESGAIALDPIPADIAALRTVDEVERAIVEQLPAVDCPVRHLRTPGLWSRTVFMPAGSIITSKIHRTEHQYVVSRGKLTIWNPSDGSRQTIEAPFMGVTAAGTRRVAYIHEDTLWTTFHADDANTVEELEASIIEPRTEHLAGLVQRRV